MTGPMLRPCGGGRALGGGCAAVRRKSERWRMRLAIEAAIRAGGDPATALPPTRHLAEFCQHKPLEMIGDRGHDVDEFAGDGRRPQEWRGLIAGRKSGEPVFDLAAPQLLDMARLRTDENHPVRDLKRLPRDLAVGLPAFALIVGHGAEHHGLPLGPYYNWARPSEIGDHAALAVPPGVDAALPCRRHNRPIRRVVVVLPQLPVTPT